MMRFFLLAVLAVYSAGIVAAPNNVQVREMTVAKDIIDSSGYVGTIVIYSESDGFYQAAYPERANKALIPASTFKIVSAVKGMMISEQTESYVIRSKTGLAVLPGDHNVGWWVGWIEKGDDRLFFASALEADFPGADFISARLAVVRELLETMGLLKNKTELGWLK
jgi:beta-lactamase class D